MYNIALVLLEGLVRNGFCLLTYLFGFSGLAARRDKRARYRAYYTSMYILLVFFIILIPAEVGTW